MNGTKGSSASGTTAAVLARERRRSRRVKTLQVVRVRPADSKDGEFDDVRATLNASLFGLYFTGWKTYYRKGMRVLVTFPFLDSESTNNCEYPGEIVRVEQLAKGSLGVAVRLLVPLKTQPVRQTAAAEAV